MKNETQLAVAGRRYALALATHYTKKDLRAAFGLYKGVMAAYPDSQEAGFSREQIKNIVVAVVPKEVLFDTQVEMASAHFERAEQPELALPLAATPASEQPG